jgi:RNA polymerase sigma-70 factor (ECF subfamily)
VRSEKNTCSDVELACEVQAGSLAAFEELVCRHEARIFQFLKCRVGSAHDAEDLTQVVFVRAYRNIGKFSPRYPFTAWLYTIARRESVNHYRRGAVARACALPDDLLDTRSDPSREAALSDARESVWNVARGKLSESQFAALYLYAHEQMSVKEIARTLKKTQNHVKVLLHRARRQMVKELAAGDDCVAAIRDAARRTPDAAVLEMAQADLPHGVMGRRL